MKETLRRRIVLVILYLGFISLGLPDQILGIAWPDMRADFGKPLDWAGILVVMTAALTAFSGFVSGFFIRRFSVQSILIVSCLMTALGLCGYSWSNRWLLLVLSTIPLGLGAGAIDTSLNNYVANNYSSRHMNWLHACWGIGATLGPTVMTFVLAHGQSWRLGYLAIAASQFLLLIIFVATLRLWKQQKQEEPAEITAGKKFKLFSVRPLCALGMFFIYSSVEVSLGLWFYSVLVEGRRVTAAMAGSWIVIYWSLLTFGRFAVGIFSNRLGNLRIIRWGLRGTLLGIALLLPHNDFLTAFGLGLCGLALAGIYPSMMHETPVRFGKKAGALMMGFQAGMSSLGVSLLVPLYGVVIERTSLECLTPMLFSAIAAMYALNRILEQKA